MKCYSTYCHSHLNLNIVTGTFFANCSPSNHNLNIIKFWNIFKTGIHPHMGTIRCNWKCKIQIKWPISGFTTSKIWYSFYINHLDINGCGANEGPWLWNNLQLNLQPYFPFAQFLTLTDSFVVHGLHSFVITSYAWPGGRLLNLRFTCMSRHTDLSLLSKFHLLQTL